MIRIVFLPFGEGVRLGFPPVGRKSKADSFDAPCRLPVRELIHNNSAIGIRLRKFGLALEASPPILSRAKQLIFLCGANQAPETPSARRTAVKRFIHGLSTSYTVIYAEGIFKELTKLGNNKNVLDLEHEISTIADRIIIILESESAFCELGAFAHIELRHKLIVINNSKFRHSGSFINTGPLAAVAEAKSPTLWYPMTIGGVSIVDGIGATFSALRKALEHKSTHGDKIPYAELSNLGMTKYCLYFIHDLVLFSGPVTHQEIIFILKSIFGRKSFDPLKNLLGILREGQLVQVKQLTTTSWVYRASSVEPFLKYSTNTIPLLSAFRTFHLKNSPSRFDYA